VSVTRRRKTHLRSRRHKFAARVDMEPTVGARPVSPRIEFAVGKPSRTESARDRDYVESCFHIR
jgi:hypothetical protein